MQVGCRTLIAVSILVLTMAYDRVLQAQTVPALAGGLKAGALFDELARVLSLDHETIPAEEE